MNKFFKITFTYGKGGGFFDNEIWYYKDNEKERKEILEEYGKHCGEIEQSNIITLEQAIFYSLYESNGDREEVLEYFNDYGLDLVFNFEVTGG